MQTSSDSNFIPIIISIIAALVSFASFWKSHLADFKPISVIGDISFRIYPIRSGDEKWFLPSFVIPFSITNAGARPGKILAIRLLAHYPELSLLGNRETFMPRWEVDYQKFTSCSKNRFKWIEEATLGNWRPFVILPKETVTKNLVFETRWDSPVIQKMSLKLQVYTDSIFEEWTDIGSWDIELDPFVWTATVNHGSSFGFPSKQKIHFEDPIYPEDLHQHLGPTEPIPDVAASIEPSYLDYPEDDCYKEGDIV